MPPAAPQVTQNDSAMKAAKLYAEFHSGSIYVAYAIFMALLTLILAFRSLMQLFGNVRNSAAIIQVGEGFCIFTLLGELVVLLYFAFQLEGVSISGYHLFQKDAALFVYCLLLFVMSEATAEIELANFLDLAWMVPLLVRDYHVIRGALLDGAESWSGVELASA